ncbi:TBC1 domain family member 5 homolog A-like [Microplitis mediator]|uniref:TBC1 domain family member 5 homolog A-like n=1 Tax=Microplitis mediator TaxID=375433 RepID=UPI00255508B2|nr:TBC1 domain family member 5 homolog A-like [Microplitis mediator]
MEITKKCAKTHRRRKRLIKNRRKNRNKYYSKFKFKNNYNNQFNNHIISDDPLFINNKNIMDFKVPDSFWDTYKFAQDWQHKHQVNWWKSKCIALEHENNLLRDKIRELVGYYNNNNANIYVNKQQSDSNYDKQKNYRNRNFKNQELYSSKQNIDNSSDQNQYEDFKRFELESNGQCQYSSNNYQYFQYQYQDSNQFNSSTGQYAEEEEKEEEEEFREEEELEFQVDEGMMKFLEQSIRHKMELKRKRELAAEEAKNDEVEIVSHENDDKIRLEEAKLLYGVACSRVIAIETTMQVSIDKYKAKEEPEYWPIIPLKP